MFSGFQIAMDDTVFVRVMDCGADLLKQSQPVGDRKLVVLAILVDGLAFDILHYKVRKAVLCRSAIEESGDVRMIETGEDLPLIAKAAHNKVGIHAPVDEFDRDTSFKLGVSTNRQIDRPHSAATDFAFVR